ncbi:MAG: PaaI family thioesterase [Flavobacteriales bacterium]
MNPHYELLSRLYINAPVNIPLNPSISIEEGQCTIEMETGINFHHAAGGTHGAILFKLLDDAAFFAANSVQKEFFLLTLNFNINYVRPAINGRLTAKGKLKTVTKQYLTAEAEVFNHQGKLCAFGSGTFAVSKLMLSEMNPKTNY